MKKYSKIISFSIIIILLFSICGCNAGNSSNKITIWTMPADTKIMADKNYSDYYSQNTLDVFMAKNETESGQIIITPTKSVKQYTVKVSDLISGNEKITSDNIKIYNQKYIEVTQSSKNMDTPLGYYPDALLPFETAIEYNENNIEAGKNQGVWIAITTSEETKAGLYSGNIQLDIDGKVSIVPLNVNVWDITIPSEVHSKSLFYTKPRFYAMAEKNPTDELMTAYVDKLLDFRLSPLYLPYFGSVDMANENVNEYVEQIVKYTSDKRLTYYQIPYSTKLDAVGKKILDDNSLATYITAIALKSVELQRNLLEKAGLYLSNLIDEPELNGAVGDIKTHYNSVEKAKNTAIKAINELPNSEFKTEIINSIKNIPHLLTNRHINGQDDYVDIWCPTLDKFNTRDNRKVYEKEEEVWWYGCIDPQAPYATYYIDDLSPAPRIMSWMQKDYNIAGNLYWAVDLYGDRFDISKKINPYTDAPDRAAWADTNRANGDGFLFYPGSYYGLDSPVASIRLHSIRDGLEDYEVLYQIEKLYNEQKASSDDILALVYKNLYEGTKIIGNAQDVSFARQKIAEILLLAKNNIFINKVEFVGDVVSVEALNSNNKEVKINGKVASSQQIKLDKDSNILKIESDGKEFSINLCGKVNYLDLGKESSVLSSSNGVISKEDDKAKISLTQVNGDKRQRFTIGGELVNNISKNSSVAMEIYADKTSQHAENMRLEVLIEGSKNSIFNSYEIITLEEGKNIIYLDSLYHLKWNNIGKIKNIHFNIGEQGSVARNIYIKDITVYEK